MKLKQFLILLFILSTFLTQAQEVSLGAGHYNLSPVAGALVPSDYTGTPTYPKVTANFNQPAQTNDWWTSLLWAYETDKDFNWGMHSWRLYAHPMCYQANRYGLRAVYPTNLEVINPYNTWASAKYQYQMTDVEDLTVSLMGLDMDAATPTPAHVKVDNYGDWDVTAQWNDGSNVLNITMAHGSPFLYCTKNGGDAVVRMRQPHTIDNTIGTNVVGITTGGHHYGVFFPTGAIFNVQPIQHDHNELTANGSLLSWRDAFVSDLNGKDYFSIALLPDNSLATLSLFAQHAFAFVDNTSVDWNYDDATAMLTSTFNLSTTAKEGTETETLTALYRHQWLNTNDVNTAYTYQSPRGEMKVVKGNIFTTSIQNKGILPELPWAGTYDSLLLYQFIEDERQATNVYTADDTYWLGKRLSRQSELIQLAHSVGHTAARDELLNEMKTEMEDWLQADDGETNRGYFYYDSNWQTLIGYPASFGSEKQINDHHFHYGYFIKAAATIAQFDPAWAVESAWGGMINLIIKDVANWDRNDPMFPFLRTYDVYAGHSWANGQCNLFFGNDQESSSEAINFAGSVFLWGLNTDNTTLRDLGLFLYLSEIEAVEQYWFDIDNTVFPNGYAYKTAARIWGNGAEKVSGSQWFEIEPEYMLGINLLPLDGTALYLGRNPAIVQSVFEEMQVMNASSPTPLWDDMMWGYQALYDPSTALASYKAATTPNAYNTNLPWLPNVNGIYEPLSGDAFSPSQLYHWLHTLDSLGQVDATVTADYPAAMVFNKNGLKHYVVYTPPSLSPKAPITVTFSDGVSFPVEAGLLYVYQPPAYVEVQAKVMLEGPFNSSTLLMDDFLRQANSIPSTEPFTSIGYTPINQTNSEIIENPNTVFNVTGNNAIIDWIWLESRE